MDLTLSETQEMLKAGIHKLLQHEVTYERVRDVQATGRADDALWTSLGAAGWLSLPFPGGDAELVDVAVAVEEVARSAAIVPFAETMAGAYVVARSGSSAALDALAGPVQEGAAAVTAAIGSEGGRETEATVADGRVRGLKRYVDYGQSCRYHLVRAGRDGDIGLYLVDTTTGVTTEALRNVGKTPQANVAYHDADAQPAGGPESVARLKEVSTVLCCVQLLAYAQLALDLTVPYVRDRVQFGRSLGTFQAVQQECADMAMAVEAARYLTYETVWKVQHSTATLTDLAMAKAAASRTGTFVTMQAHQLHGGIGMTEEYPLQFFSRRAKERSLAWGSEHEWMQQVARTVDKDEDWR